MRSVIFLPVLTITAAVFPALLPAPAFGHGESHEAIAVLTKEIENHPGSSSLFMERASLLADHGDYAGAIADLDRLKMLDPANDQQKALRGSILRRSGQPGAARKEQEAFLQKHPGQAQVQFDYCRTLIDLQDSAAAITALDKVITNAKAPSPDAVALRIKVTEAAGESGPSEALKWVKGFLQKHPLPVFEEEALRLELKTGRTADALHRMDGLIAKSPRPETLCLRKADLLAAAGNSQGAIAAAAAAKEAINRLPEHIRSTRACAELEARADHHLSP